MACADLCTEQTRIYKLEATLNAVRIAFLQIASRLRVADKRDPIAGFPETESLVGFALHTHGHNRLPALRDCCLPSASK